MGGGIIFLPCYCFGSVVDLHVNDIADCEVKRFMAGVKFLLEVGPRVGII